MTTKQRFCFYFSKIIWLCFCTSHFSNAPETQPEHFHFALLWHTHTLHPALHTDSTWLCLLLFLLLITPMALNAPGDFLFSPLFPWKFKVVGGNVRNWTETFCLPSTLEIGNFALSNRVNLQFLNVKLSLNTAQSSLRK